MLEIIEKYQEELKEHLSIDEFNLKDLVGKVVEGKYFSRPRYPLKMRRVEL